MKRKKDPFRTLFYDLSQSGAQHGRGPGGAQEFSDWLDYILEGPFHLRITEAQ